MVDSAAHPTLDQIDHAHGDDHSGHTRIYLRVFVALAAFTAVEYVYARLFKDAFLVLVVGLMTWAILKAALVGLYFMHLKYEGKWVYAMLVPAGFLACVLVLGLLPDMALQPVTDVNLNSRPTTVPVPGEPAPAASPTPRP